MRVKGYLYIIQSQKSQHYYIGSTTDPNRRLEQHNANANRATRSKGPWNRVALLQFSDLNAAKTAESWLKRMKSRRIITMVVLGTFEWKPEFRVEAVLETSR